MDIEAYQMAQQAVSLMKIAIVRLLSESPEGLKNSDIGRRLGVNGDHLGGQPGWFPWTVLKMMELDRTVEQPVPKGPWKLVDLSSADQSEASQG